MPDVISDTNGKLCVGRYHMWRLYPNPDNYSLSTVVIFEKRHTIHDHVGSFLNFKTPQIPYVLEFECNRPNGNSGTNSHGIQVRIQGGAPGARAPP